MKERKTFTGHWTVTFFFLSIVTALITFGGISSKVAMVGEYLFFAFLALGFESIIAGIVKRLKAQEST